MTKKPLMVVWRVIAISGVLWIIINFMILFVPLVKASTKRDIKMKWVLDQIVDRYAEDIWGDLIHEDILSYSYRSFSRKYHSFGINESYSGILILVIQKNGSEEIIECYWCMGINDKSINVEKWKYL